MDEKLRILKMLEEGKITAEQASALLDALQAKEEAEAKELPHTEEELVYSRRMVHIQIHSPEKEDINLKFPVLSLRRLIQFTGTIPGIDIGMKTFDFDLNATLNSVADGIDKQIVGEIVKISVKDGSYIRIYVE